MKFLTPNKILKIENKYEENFFDCPILIHEDTINVALELGQNFEGNLSSTTLARIVQRMDHNKEHMSDAQIHQELLEAIEEYPHIMVQKEMQTLWLSLIAHAHNSLVLEKLYE